MSDIVETLRQRREVEHIGGYVHVVWEDKEALEAADEIERLRAALREVQEIAHSDSSEDVRLIGIGLTASAALEDKDE